MAGGDKMHLRSKEGDLFDISSDAARLSNLVATMQDDGLDDESIPLLNVTKGTLTKVVSYMEYHAAKPAAELGAQLGTKVCFGRSYHGQQTYLNSWRS